MSKVTKAVIPAGGFGTRFLPATKSIPKEMFPIGNKPVILHVIKEVVESGITDIIIIVSHHKHAIEELLTSNIMLEKYYLSLGKKEKVKELREIIKMANFTFVYTTPPHGNGGCIKATEHLIGTEPFVVVWADELFITTNGKTRLRQCLDAFDQYQIPVISAAKINERNRRSRYGMAKLKSFNGEKNIKEIVRIVEKPKPGTEPSHYATHGAYVMTHHFFDALKKTKLGKNDELWIADIINNMKKETGLLACIIEDGIYLDCGVPLDYLISNVEFSLANKLYDSELRQRLQKLLLKY